MPSMACELRKENMALLFPNPTQNQLTLKLTDPNEQSINEVFVTDIVGTKVLEFKSHNTSEIVISTSHLSNGLYLLSVIAGNNYSQLKFIKQ